MSDQQSTTEAATPELFRACRECSGPCYKDGLCYRCYKLRQRMEARIRELGVRS